MGFVASEAVPALEWDFTAYGGPDARGVSLEPSDVMVERFKRKQMRLATALAEQIELTTKQLEADDQEVQIRALLPFKEAVAQIGAIEGDDELSRNAQQQMAEITAEVLGGCPNVEQILHLPLRVRTVFFGWITGQLLNPESFAAATKL